MVLEGNKRPVVRRRGRPKAKPELVQELLRRGPEGYGTGKPKGETKLLPFEAGWMLRLGIDDRLTVSGLANRTFLSTATIQKYAEIYAGQMPAERLTPVQRQYIINLCTELYELEVTRQELRLKHDNLKKRREEAYRRELRYV